MSTARERLVAAGAQLKGAFVGRDQAVDCILLALVTGANFILVGDPGTAKSALVRRAFAHVEGASQFSILCGSFATKDEVFGPTNIKAFQAGEWSRVTKGRLADVELAFLDEVMKSNDGTLNSLLGVLNEREFDGKPAPLWTCGAATNWPEVRSRSENVGALWDRFLLRCRVDCLTDPKERAAMVEAAEVVRTYAPAEKVTVEELKAARDEARQVTASRAFVDTLVNVAHRLQAEQVSVSDRRLALLVDAAKAAAWLEGRTAVGLDDLDALRFGLWNDEAHVAVVNSIVDSADDAEKKRCLKLIAEAKAGLARDLKGDPAVAALRVATNAAKEVGPVLRDNMLRKANHALVTKELKELQQSFYSMHAKLKPYLTVGVDMATEEKKEEGVK